MKWSQLRRRTREFRQGEIDAKTFLAEVWPSIEQLLPVLQRAANVFKPGTFWGDVILLLKRAPSEDALRRLAAIYFTRGSVFYPDRWLLLEEHFQEYVREFNYELADTDRKSYDEVYVSLVMGAILTAVRRIPAEKYLPEVPTLIRREVQKEIERALLDGWTLKEYTDRRKTTLVIPDEDMPEAQELDACLAEETIAFSAVRFDVLRILATLTEKERKVILNQVAGYSDEEQAAQEKVTPAAIRKRLERARRHLEKSLKS